MLVIDVSVSPEAETLKGNEALSLLGLRTSRKIEIEIEIVGFVSQPTSNFVKE